MRSLRLGVILAAVAVISLSACHSAVVSGDGLGSVRTRFVQLPSAVQAVRVTVTGTGIAGDVRADLTMDGGGNWAGLVPNVPPGDADRTVTAYAYSSPSMPDDPVADTTNLIYRGAVEGVSVNAGQTSLVTIVLVPFPGGDGGAGTNTPPHIVFGAHPASILSTDSIALTAAAYDPDPGTTLTYTWDDGGAGGSFSGGTGNPASDQAPGVTISIQYQPAASFSGTATIRLSVTDGQAEVSRSTWFDVQPGTGAVDPTLVFDAGPEIAITSVSSQELVPSGSAAVAYEISGGQGSLELTWSDSCAGSFGGYNWWRDDASTFSDSVVYTAPASAPDSPGECDLRLQVVDGYGASTWSQVVVWVDPANGRLFPGKVVFLTSSTVQGGTFGGSQAAADAFCQSAAESGTGPNAPPAGSYRAFLSFPGNDARDSVANSAYVLGDGSGVAASKADLLSGALLHAIDMDENGAVVTQGNGPAAEVWTGSLVDGTFDSTYTQCQGWTSSLMADRATAGDAYTTDGTWVVAPPSRSPYSGFWCSDHHPVYCFQQ